MLHGTLTPAQNRRVRLVAAIVMAATAAILTLAATPAHALSRTADAHRDGNVVRIVRLADGSVRVERGLSFHAAEAGTVIAEETDVTFSTTVVDITDALGDAGLVDDDFRAEQWGLDLLDAEAIWERADGAGQIIAIVDSGVDGSHPDFRGQLVDGFSATGGDPLVDGHGHGTHVAGTAAAAVDSFGVAGLAHEAKIMPIQVTDAAGLAYASDVAEGLIWAVNNGATVANLSLAGTQRSTVLDAAIDYAIANDVVVVVAAGNEYNRDNPRTYPASHDDVIAVGAVRDAETRSSFSSTGDWVDVVAPGSAIISTRPDAAHGYASGTSMASPSVAAAVALLRGAADLTTTEVAEVLTSTATDLGRNGRDDETGHGLINLIAALDELGVTGPELPENADDAPSVDEATGTDLLDSAPDAEDIENVDGADDFHEVTAPVTDHTNAEIDNTSWLDQGWGV